MKITIKPKASKSYVISRETCDTKYITDLLDGPAITVTFSI